MNKFFITATGTGVGKTFVTTSLCRQLIEQGKMVAAFKPVISGYGWIDNNYVSLRGGMADVAIQKAQHAETTGLLPAAPSAYSRNDEFIDRQSDSALILQSYGLEITAKNINKISPWRFAAPLSPNMAANREGKNISLDELVAFCKIQEESQADILLAEGVGGVCVPLNDKYTVLDWMVALTDWKIILVTGSYLGTISHTLTAVQALAARNLQIHALIVSESENSPVPLAETIETLANFLPKSVSIVSLPRQQETNCKNMPKISEICV